MRPGIVFLFLLASFFATSPPSEASVIIFVTQMSGPAEAPPNLSPGVGFAQVDLDTTLQTMRVQATFSGLLGNVTVAHIHSATTLPGTGTVGVATAVPTFPGFPSGVTSGTYDQTFDLTLASTYNPSFITANGGTPASASAALTTGLLNRKAYLNIHTNQFPGGEIRGFLTPVPEPTSMMLMALGAPVLAWVARRRRTVPV